MNSLLSVTHLSKRYPSFSLEDVSFSITPGRVMGLIGKNGAGKSTTLKCLLHMSQPDYGQVLAFGQDYFQNETTLKPSLGIVFGGIDFYPLKKLSAITSVVRLFYQNWDQARYESYLHRFALEENKKFKELSNGMKVKYLLALALSHHAKLLILDEPTSGLDPVSRDELLHIFLQIVDDGQKSILFSTHITSDLDRCADDITYLQNGRVLLSAEKQTFLQSFAHLQHSEDTVPLTLEQIMLRTERSPWDETAL